MSDNVSNELMYELMKRVHNDVLDLRPEVRELRQRVSAVELHMTGNIAGVQMANERLDRLQGDVTQIKRRLELVEA